MLNSKVMNTLKKLFFIHCRDVALLDERPLLNKYKLLIQPHI